LSGDPPGTQGELLRRSEAERRALSSAMEQVREMRRASAAPAHGSLAPAHAPAAEAALRAAGEAALEELLLELRQVRQSRTTPGCPNALRSNVNPSHYQRSHTNHRCARAAPSSTAPKTPLPNVNTSHD